jgi:hypothetical protein
MSHKSASRMRMECCSAANDRHCDVSRGSRHHRLDNQPDNIVAHQYNHSHAGRVDCIVDADERTVHIDGCANAAFCYVGHHAQAGNHHDGIVNTTLSNATTHSGIGIANAGADPI